MIRRPEQLLLDHVTGRAGAAEFANLFMCDVCWHIDVHDTKAFADCPVNVLCDAVHL